MNVSHNNQKWHCEFIDVLSHMIMEKVNLRGIIVVIILGYIIGLGLFRLFPLEEAKALFPFKFQAYV